MRNNGLDEMQVQRRNKIGNQAFMLLFYLLMIDIGLYGFGFRWLKYPTNVFVIMLLCMSYYLVRLIWNNAYIGPKTADKPVGKAVFVVIIAAVISAVVLFLTNKNPISTSQIQGYDDNGAIILFIISVVALIIAFVVSIITKRQNSNDE